MKVQSLYFLDSSPALDVHTLTFKLKVCTIHYLISISTYCGTVKITMNSSTSKYLWI